MRTWICVTKIVQGSNIVVNSHFRKEDEEFIAYAKSLDSD